MWLNDLVLCLRYNVFSLLKVLVDEEEKRTLVYFLELFSKKSTVHRRGALCELLVDPKAGEDLHTLSATMILGQLSTVPEV